MEKEKRWNSRMLYSSPPLVINPELAVVFGLNESIILQQVHYWLQKNVERGQNYRDGDYWTYNAYGDWQKQFPFWSKDTIKRAITGLERKGVLVSENFNKVGFDRTKWYRIDYEMMDEFLAQYISGIGECKMPSPMGAKCPHRQTVGLTDVPPEKMSEIRDIKNAENMFKIDRIYTRFGE